VNGVGKFGLPRFAGRQATFSANADRGVNVYPSVRASRAQEVNSIFSPARGGDESDRETKVSQETGLIEIRLTEEWKRRPWRCRRSSSSNVAEPDPRSALNNVMRGENRADVCSTFLQIYTVGNFLSAWRSPKNQKSIEQVFDSPQQARHAGRSVRCHGWASARMAATRHRVSAGGGRATCSRPCRRKRCPAARLRTVALLIISNVFMTFAWYEHLRFTKKSLWAVVLMSWGIAFFEYCFQVPANRIGYLEGWSPSQLKNRPGSDHADDLRAVRSDRASTSNSSGNHFVGFGLICLAVFLRVSQVVAHRAAPLGSLPLKRRSPRRRGGFVS
jgi:hypothetical protein